MNVIVTAKTNMGKWARENEITVTAKFASEADKTKQRYTVNLSYKGKKVRGLIVENEDDDAIAILRILAMDARIVEEMPDFLPEHCKGKPYETMKKQTDRLYELLGDSAYGEFVWETE